MRTWAKGSARAALLTASFVALGAGAAHADVTSGHHSLLGGNQISPQINVPVDVSGNSISILGHSRAHSTGGAEATSGSGGSGNRTSGNHSIGGGNQVDPQANVPVNVSGNAAAVGGRASAESKGGAKATSGSGAGSGDSGDKTSGNHSILGGNQISPQVNVPVNVCGNSIAVLGSTHSTCNGGAEATSGSGGSGDQTSGNHSIGGGNQVDPQANVPVNVCGNAAAVLGRAKASCKGGAEAKSGSGHDGGYGSSGAKGDETSGNHSILGGNQSDPVVNVPVNLCGNAVSVLGNAAAGCGVVTYMTYAAPAPQMTTMAAHGSDTSGDHSVGGGNQVITPINGSGDICGNSVVLLGSANADCSNDGVVPPGPGGPSDGGTPPGDGTPGGGTPGGGTPGGGTPGGGAPGDVVPPTDGGTTPVEITPPVHNAPVSDLGQGVAPVHAAAPSGATELPFTGMHLGSLLALAFGALAAGGACLVAASRRRVRLHRG